jgi:hypothetical protein
MRYCFIGARQVRCYLWATKSTGVTNERQHRQLISLAGVMFVLPDICDVFRTGAGNEILYVSGK